MDNALINKYTGASLEYCHLIQDETIFPVWNKAAENEFGRLAQGVGGRIEGSNTIFFIPRNAVPKGTSKCLWNSTISTEGANYMFGRQYFLPWYPNGLL
jgi:hypothetical protein